MCVPSAGYFSPLSDRLYGCFTDPGGVCRYTGYVLPSTRRTRGRWQVKYEKLFGRSCAALIGLSAIVRRWRWRWRTQRCAGFAHAVSVRFQRKLTGGLEIRTWYLYSIEYLKDLTALTSIFIHASTPKTLPHPPTGSHRSCAPTTARTSFCDCRWENESVTFAGWRYGVVDSRYVFVDFVCLTAHLRKVFKIPPLPSKLFVVELEVSELTTHSYVMCLTMYYVTHMSRFSEKNISIVVYYVQKTLAVLVHFWWHI